MGSFIYFRISADLFLLRQTTIVSRVGHPVVEDADQVLAVDELGRQARPDGVVRAADTLNALAAQVRVQLLRPVEAAFARL